MNTTMIKPENKGERVTSLSQLADLAKAKKAVFTTKYMVTCKHCPAAFVLSMQGRIINNMINSGLYVYRKVDK